jgi:CRP-like cAMP-binding protein
MPTLASQFACITELKPSTARRFQQDLIPQTYAPGQVFFSQQEKTCGLYLLQAGAVFIYRQSGGKRQVLALLGPGECFGGEGVLSHSSPSYTARAILATQVLYLPPDQLAAYIQESPDFLTVFLGLVTRRLRQLTSLVHDLAFRDVPSRLAAVLVMLSERYGQSETGGVYLAQVISQVEMSEMVGTAREVIYRALKSFEAQGILKKDPQGILIYDLKALRRIAELEAR